MTNSAGSDTNASDRRRYSSRSSSWSSLVLASSAFVAPRHFEARRVSSLFRRIPIGEPPRAFAPACQEPVMSCTRRTSPRGPLLSYRHAAPGTAPSCGPWHRADSSSRPAARDGARAIRRRSRLDAPASRTRIWRMLRIPNSALRQGQARVAAAASGEGPGGVSASIGTALWLATMRAP